MALNLARTGTAVAVGLIDGVVEAKMATPAFTLGTTAIHWSTIAEGVAVLGGAAWQFMAPYSMPNIADGLVEGGGALLAKRLTGMALGGTGTGAMLRTAPRGVAQRVAPFGMASGRAAVGSVGYQSPTRVRLT